MVDNTRQLIPVFQRNQPLGNHAGSNRLRRIGEISQLDLEFNLVAWQLLGLGITPWLACHLGSRGLAIVAIGHILRHLHQDHINGSVLVHLLHVDGRLKPVKRRVLYLLGHTLEKIVR